MINDTYVMVRLVFSPQPALRHCREVWAINKIISVILVVSPFVFVVRFVVVAVTFLFDAVLFRLAAPAPRPQYMSFIIKMVYFNKTLVIVWVC